jgi:hypothetical protein
MFGLSLSELFVVGTLVVPLTLLMAGICFLALYTTYLVVHDGFVRALEHMHLRHTKAH